MQEEFTSTPSSVQQEHDAGEPFTVTAQPYHGVGNAASKSMAPLRRGDQRLSTAQRQITATLKNTESGSSHLSIDDIFRHLMRTGEKVSHSTIYRTLARMEADGQVTRHQFVSGASVFELAESHRHDHFVEIESSKIVDFESSDFERLLHDVADNHDMELLDYKIVLFVRPHDADAPHDTNDSHTNE